VKTGEDQLESFFQSRHRGFSRELNHSGLGKRHAMTSLLQFSKMPCEIELSPLLGESNEYVPEEILGLSEEEACNLVVNGILE
jgi:hypothetical protein